MESKPTSLDLSFNKRPISAVYANYNIGVTLDEAGCFPLHLLPLPLSETALSGSGVGREQSAYMYI